MKTIYLVRHGKAVKRDEKLPDFQRTLVKKGKEESSDMANKIKKVGICPDLLISSSADRALETAHIFAQRIGYPKKKIMVKDSLYNVLKEEVLLEIIQNVDNTYSSIMLFGHEPAFSNFAAFLLKDFSDNFPKSGIVSIDFRRKTWKGVTKGNGRLKHFDYPRQISKAYKNTEFELAAEISDMIEKFLQKVDRQSAEKIQKSIDKSSLILAQDFVEAMKTFKIKEKELKGFRKVKPPKTKTEVPAQTIEKEEKPEDSKNSTTQKTTISPGKPTKKQREKTQAPKKK
ncbi:MAG: histidine phosphatase family protein [Candidatus Aminicenantes bacterium]|nr:histidine phosphatase family protein [Candidatus Aminicenantes bacterium]